MAINTQQLTPRTTRSKVMGTGFGAKFLRFPLVRLVLLTLALVGGSLLHPLYSRLLKPLIDEDWLLWINGIEKLLLIAILLLVYRWSVGLIERRQALETGTEGALLELSTGVGLGGLMICLAVAMIVIFGGFQIVGVNPPGILIYAFLFTAAYALLEDLIFRAVLFRTCEEWLGTWLAIALVAALFGLVHLPGEDATLISSFALAVGDLSLAGAFVLTRRIWMVWGIHIGWNFFQEKIFGMANSGRQPKFNLLDVSVEGPNWVTGGAYGVENSIPGVLFSILVGGVLLFYAHHKGQFVAPSWKQSPTSGNS